ncbi:hypothetical protein CRM22_008631 [Opisthorchis felineus]|uniref:Uncharacterized protein n=1 Tax=Opisthorchis felineus TaxID=147828 RepID=A0A4S2LHD1_OPIFE|nr:hypothetical protein CRM22_008631 [Opisthorchis felineus]
MLTGFRLRRVIGCLQKQTGGWNVLRTLPQHLSTTINKQRFPVDVIFAIRRVDATVAINNPSSPTSTYQTTVVLILPLALSLENLALHQLVREAEQLKQTLADLSEIPDNSESTRPNLECAPMSVQLAFLDSDGRVLLMSASCDLTPVDEKQCIRTSALI